MCGPGTLCGQGWRVDATDLHTGRVKAVLHPVDMGWDECHSAVGQGTISAAIRDPKPDDIWAHETGIYISRVKDDGTRYGHFGGLIESWDGSTSSGTVNIGMKSIDAYLFGREIADDSGGLLYDVDERPQTEIAADLVALASPKGIPLYASPLPSEHNRDRTWNPWEFKNIGEAIAELCGVINGLYYLPQHTYFNGYWSTTLVFSDSLGTNRNLVLKGDREGWQYSLQVNASQQATRVFAIGSGEQDAQLTAIAYDDAERLPIWHAAPAWKDVTILETLYEHAAGYVAQYRDPVATPGMTIAGMDPDPVKLVTGDRVHVDFGYGLVVFKGDAIVQNQAWKISALGNTPPTRELALSPLLRPATSIRTQVAIHRPGITDPVDSTPQEDTVPTAEADPTPGLLSNITDSRINESSGLAYSPSVGGMAWTHNDEDGNPQVFGIRVSDGSTIAAAGIAATFHDPEAISFAPDHRLFLADTGDNDNNRTNCALYAIGEPPLGTSGEITPTRYPLTYPMGSMNAEALAINPISGEVLVITKETHGRVMSFGNHASLSTTSNTGVVVATPLDMNLVSDACFTVTGKYLLVRCKGVQATRVYDAHTYAKVMEIASPAVKKGESITAEPEGKSFLMGSEGAGSPIYRVLLPQELRADLVPANSVPAISLANWKLTLPTHNGQLCGGCAPADEIKQPQLATYSGPYFHVTADGGTLFNAPANGARTSTNTKYPRCELREQIPASWDSHQGTHIMEILQKVTQLPGNGHLVAGQVHDADNDITVCRIEGSDIYFTSGNNDHYIHAGAGYVLGTKFSVKFVATSTGIQCFLNGVLQGTVPSAGSGYYFKAGAYTQDNANGVGEVVIYGLSVSHA